jgi:hypothetical protein
VDLGKARLLILQRNCIIILNSSFYYYFVLKFVVPSKNVVSCVQKMHGYHHHYLRCCSQSGASRLLRPPSGSREVSEAWLWQSAVCSEVEWVCAVLRECCVDKWTAGGPGRLDVYSDIGSEYYDNTTNMWKIYKLKYFVTNKAPVLTD